jgi:hypothetical protein
METPFLSETFSQLKRPHCMYSLPWISKHFCHICKIHTISNRVVLCREWHDPAYNYKHYFAYFKRWASSSITSCLFLKIGFLLDDLWLPPFVFLSQLDQFLIDDLHPVLMLDASLTSHPIVQTVAHPDEITGLFDTISYSKVSSFTDILVSVNT